VIELRSNKSTDRETQWTAISTTFTTAHKPTFKSTNLAAQQTAIASTNSSAQSTTIDATKLATIDQTHHPTCSATNVAPNGSTINCSQWKAIHATAGTSHRLSLDNPQWPAHSTTCSSTNCTPNGVPDCSSYESANQHSYRDANYTTNWYSHSNPFCTAHKQTISSTSSGTHIAAIDTTSSCANY
jgi:hypothetical protein